MADAKNIILPLFASSTSSPTLNSLSLNDSDNAVAMVFQAPAGASITITKIGVRLTSITGTTPTYKASIQGVDASGNPNGTIKGGGSPNSATFSPSGLSWTAATFHWITLDNAYVTTPGEFLALNVVYDSGTVNGSNFASFAYYTSSLLPDLGMQYALDWQTAWTKRDGVPLVAFATSSRPYGFPLQSISSQTFTSTGTNEYGMVFTIPSGWCSTYKVAGVQTLYSCPAASTFDVNLYNGGNAGDTTVLQSVTTVDGDFSAAGNRQQQILFTTTPLVTLTAGNTYRIAFKAGGAVNNTLYYTDLANASDRDAWPMQQSSFWTSRAGGNWTDTTTRTAYMALLLDDITGGSGGGAIAPTIVLGGQGVSVQ